MSSNKLSNMTRRFKRKKRGDSGDADTRTTEEIIKTLDLSTACSMLTDKVDRCPDGYGGSTTLSSIYETYFQNALRNDIPQSRRGEVKASIFTQTYIPAQPQWAQWSQRLDSKTEKVAIQIVAEHVFGEADVGVRLIILTFAQESQKTCSHLPTELVVMPLRIQ